MKVTVSDGVTTTAGSHHMITTLLPVENKSRMLETLKLGLVQLFSGRLAGRPRQD